MGSTPRERLTQIPLPTRSSEAGAECPGRTFLTYLRPEDERPASFYILGDILHRTIEGVILTDLDLDQGRVYMDGLINTELDRVKGKPVVEGMQRSMESLLGDADRMITNWFAHVHPDSDKRHPFYNDYHWPPRTEVQFYNDNLGTRYPVWGSVDALFEAKLSGHAIVDWKSGVKRPDSQFQLDYYRFGMELPEAVAAYHMLDRVRKQSIVLEADPFPGELAIRDAISLTERSKDATVQGVMPRFNPGWYCGYCTVQHICPADGNPNNRDRNRKQLVKIIAKAEAMQEIPGVT